MNDMERQRQTGRLSLFVLLAVIAPAALLRGQEIPLSGRADPHYAAFDQIVLTAMREHGATAATLVIRSNGHFVYERGYGWLDEQKSKPAPPDALCRIASLTKPITAAAV